MARIALAGFMHETNTFAPHLAPYEEFERRDAWPGLSRGEALLENLDGLNIGMSGFMAAARGAGHELVPLLWCSAEPSSYVTRDAYERIVGMLCEDLAAAGPIDGLYLDFHGAMVAEHLEDGEGEALRRLREVVGPDLPVVMSLDLHANVTAAMVDRASVITIFRTYPHVDMAKTGQRSCDVMSRLLAGERMRKAFLQLPFLVPLSAQCTDFPPVSELYASVEEIGGSGCASIDLAMGFPPSDIAECGPAVVAYDPDPARAIAAVDRVFTQFLHAESDFDNPLLTPEAAVARAMERNGPGPVVLADAQDNSGAGATSDTTGVIAALVRAGATGAVVAALYDPEAAAAAHAAGVGAEIELALGGKAGVPGQEPYAARFSVVALGSGEFECTGPMLAGGTANVGPTAALRVVAPGTDVRVVVTSVRFQCLDQAMFRHVGIEPREERIVVVKSTVHFRADFDSVALETLVVEAPGSNPCRHLGLDYRRLREGVRLEPGGPEHRRERAGRAG